MYAFRLDREGKKVDPPEPPEEKSYFPIQQYGRPVSHHHRRHPLACGWEDMDDDSFNVQPVVRPREGNIIGRAHNQETLDYFLTVVKGRFRKGDFVSWDSMIPDSPMMTMNSINYILDVVRDIDKVDWGDKLEWPRPFIMVNMGAAIYSAVTPYLRATNMMFERHLTTNELNKWIRDDVRVQDYLKSIEESYKAGTLKVQ